MKKYQFIIFVFIIFIFTSIDLQSQCAMCKAVVKSSQDGTNSVAKNLNTGILYLMAVPYILIAFIFRKQLVSLYKTFRGKNISNEDI